MDSILKCLLETLCVISLNFSIPWLKQMQQTFFLPISPLLKNKLSFLKCTTCTCIAFLSQVFSTGTKRSWQCSVTQVVPVRYIWTVPVRVVGHYGTLSFGKRVFHRDGAIFNFGVTPKREGGVYVSHLSLKIQSESFCSACQSLTEKVIKKEWWPFPQKGTIVSIKTS